MLNEALHLSLQPLPGDPTAQTEQRDWGQGDKVGVHGNTDGKFCGVGRRGGWGGGDRRWVGRGGLAN